MIVTIPQKNVPDLAAGIVATRKPGAPVIETNNYYPQQRDGLIEAIEEGTPESVWVAEQLGAPVFKVFNGIYWKHLLESGVPAAPPAGSRCRSPATTPAKQIVFDLVDQLGFDPVDAGTARGILAPAARHPGLRQGLRRRERPQGAGRGAARAAGGVPRGLTAAPTAALGTVGTGTAGVWMARAAADDRRGGTHDVSPRNAAGFVSWL